MGQRLMIQRSFETLRRFHSNVHVNLKHWKKNPNYDSQLCYVNNRSELESVANFLDWITKALSWCNFFEFDENINMDEFSEDTGYRKELLEKLFSLRTPYEYTFIQYPIDKWTQEHLGNGLLEEEGILFWRTKFSKLYSQLKKMTDGYTFYKEYLESNIKGKFSSNEEVVFGLSIGNVRSRIDESIITIPLSPTGWIVSADIPLRDDDIFLPTDTYSESIGGLDTGIHNMCELFRLYQHPQDVDGWFQKMILGLESDKVLNSCYVPLGPVTEYYMEVSLRDRSKSEFGSYSKEIIDETSSSLNANPINEIRGEIWKTLANWEDFEIDELINFIKNSEKNGKINVREISKILDVWNAFQMTAKSLDLGILYMQYLAVMLHNNVVKDIPAYNHSVLKKTKVPQKSSKYRARTIVLRSNGQKVRSLSIKMGDEKETTGVKKAPHKRRGHYRHYKSGLRIFIENIDVNKDRGVAEGQNYIIKEG